MNTVPARPSPWVVDLQLEPPCLADNTADTERLLRALHPPAGLASVQVDLDLLHELPAILRQSRWQVRCILAPTAAGTRRLLAVRPASDRQPVWGLAVDLGTTRVVLRLMNLWSLTVIAEHAFDNPQAVVGPDILARIHHTDTPGGLKELQKLIIQGINKELGDLCMAAGGRPDQIWALTLAGNTAMTHLFLGLPPPIHHPRTLYPRGQPAAGRAGR